MTAIAIFQADHGRSPWSTSFSYVGMADQVAEALIGLGWSAKQAEDAVAKVAARPEAEGANTPTVLRLALRELGR